MIRTTHEAPFLSLWRDPVLLSALAHPEYLTTARYEPILRHQLGSGQIDLLFESGQQSCVLGGVRLDPSNLITRERSPFIWPADLAASIDHLKLLAIERSITPWLRSIARARAIAAESIRCFLPSDRFERARDAGLVGATPLNRSIPRMAPFVYARRFAMNARVMIACKDSALAQAILADVAAAFIQGDAGSEDDQFARSWYCVGPVRRFSTDKPDVVLFELRGDPDASVVVIKTCPPDGSPARIVDVPSPVPWDLLFSFDAADAPAVSSFSVLAREGSIRESQALPPIRHFGGSSGTIVLAVSPEALAMRGPDIDEVKIFERRLATAGFTVYIASETGDPALAEVQLLHIFGAPFERHTILFAELALQRGIDFVFDLPPKPVDTSPFQENSLFHLYSIALDDADISRYGHAYEERRLQFADVPDTLGVENADTEARFAALTGGAVAVLAVEEDLQAVVAALPPAASVRVSARGVFAEAEPDPDAIGHLVPFAPFAFVNGVIATRSHALYAAIAAELVGVPLVLAGPVYDVQYLQVLRANAPSAIVLADADASTVSALYRKARIWVDAAPRPRSAASLMRAISCGVLPVLATDSPLSRIAGGDAPTFSLRSVDDAARVIRDAMTLSDHSSRVTALQARLLSRRDPASTLGGIMCAYSRGVTAR